MKKCDVHYLIVAILAISASVFIGTHQVRADSVSPDVLSSALLDSAALPSYILAGGGDQSAKTATIYSEIYARHLYGSGTPVPNLWLTLIIADSNATITDLQTAISSGNVFNPLLPKVRQNVQMLGNQGVFSGDNAITLTTAYTDTGSPAAGYMIAWLHGRVTAIVNLSSAASDDVSARRTEAIRIARLEDQRLVNTPGLTSLTQPPARVAPAIPSSLQATVLDGSDVRLDWLGSADADSYAVFDGYSGQYVAYPTSNSVTLRGLTPDSDYCAIVIAHNSAGWSGWSNWVCFTTPP